MAALQDEDYRVLCSVVEAGEGGVFTELAVILPDRMRREQDGMSNVHRQRSGEELVLPLGFLDGCGVEFRESVILLLQSK